MRRRDVVAGLAATGLFAGARGRAAPVEAVRGLFESHDRDRMAIGLFHEFGEGSFLFDYAHGRAGKIAQTVSGFDLLPSLDGEGDAIAHIEHVSGGISLAGVTYRQVPIVRSAFSVRSGDTLLSCERAHRADRNPEGSILLIYGSGPAPKEAFDLWAFHFLAAGWEVVTYDKRGSGKSSGDLRLADLTVLAEDAAAALAEAQRLGGPKFVGAWGASQAGWILPQLGARGLLDFIVMHMGPATTPAQQILDQVRAELAAYEFPESEIAKAVAYYALDLDVSRGRAPYAAIKDAYDKAVAEGAEWLLGPPAPADSPDRVFIRLIADFDPAPYWRRSRAKLLALFGGKDVIVPAGPNASLLRSLIPAGVPLTEIELPQANHLGFIGKTGVRAEYAKCTKLDPGYFAAIGRFLGH